MHWLSALAVWALCLMPIPILAQITPVAQMGQASLELSPRFPEPYQPVTVTLRDAGSGLSGSSITWRINGQSVPDSANRRSLELTAPELGESTFVSATLERPGGAASVVEAVIEPVYLDIVLEPQTRVPGFFKGRALPSSLSNVRLVAIINGGEITRGGLIYQWQVGGRVIGGGKQRGVDSVVAEFPRGGRTSVDLEVYDINGTQIAGRRVEVFLHEPEIVFYRTNSLYGTHAVALTDTTALSGNSLTLRAEPYSLDLATYNAPGLLTWEVNGDEQPVARLGDPYQLTLERTGDRGRAELSFHVRNLENFVGGAEGNLQLMY